MNQTTTDYLLFGGARCLAAFPLEHPLEVAKLKTQANPSFSSVQALQAVYKKRGFAGFYDGGIPNLTKRAIKVGYRWPIVAILHSYWKERMPEIGKTYPLSVQLATAGSIASIETAFVLPLERLFNAKVNDSKYGHFINSQLKKEGILSLYHGSAVNFLSHFTSWATFMGANHLGKKAADWIDQKNESPLLKKSVNILLTSSALAFVDLPLEFVKTQTQLSPEFHEKPPMAVAKVLLKRHGLRGFYSGVIFGLIHKGVQTAFGSTFFEQMTRSGTPN